MKDTFKNVMQRALAIGIGLSTLSTLGQAASWGSTYAGQGPSAYPCYGTGPGYVYDPYFSVYTITYPSDWPGYSEFGHDATFYSNGFLVGTISRSTLNNASGVSLVDGGTISAWGQPSITASVSTLHWGIYNGVYVSANSGATGFSSLCY